MPYIEEWRKEYLNDNIDYAQPDSAGELNFCLTRLCLLYLEKTNKRYDDYNSIIGVLESAKLEFYRRAVASYEDKKMVENGDVYA